MKVIGTGVTALGYGMVILLGLVGFVVTLAIIAKATGFWGFVAAFFLAPVTFTVAPLYAGFAWGDWFPAVLIYGGSLPGLGVIAVGEWVKSKAE